MSDGPRTHGCERARCPKLARRGCRFCSRSCARTAYLLTRCTPEQRSAQMRRARALQQQQELNRMLQRVKVLGQTEDERIVLAWRYGKGAAKSARYRAKRAA